MEAGKSHGTEKQAVHLPRALVYTLFTIQPVSILRDLDAQAENYRYRCYV